MNRDLGLDKTKENVSKDKENLKDNVKDVEKDVKDKVFTEGEKDQLSRKNYWNEQL